MTMSKSSIHITITRAKLFKGMSVTPLSKKELDAVIAERTQENSDTHFAVFQVFS